MADGLAGCLRNLSVDRQRSETQTITRAVSHSQFTIDTRGTPCSESMSLASLRAYYAAGGRLADVAAEVHRSATSLPETFVAVSPLADVLSRCESLATVPRGALWGAFFAVKDNIDVAGLPTTAACPAFGSGAASGSAPVVAALLDAGAICVGKTNMDQFAAGLNGTRSPYGVPKNATDARVIPGGSSSGSATAVAAGVVTFALGTDTAGSGRVPAGLQGLVGVKPTVGIISTQGVPHCFHRLLHACKVLLSGTGAHSMQPHTLAEEHAATCCQVVSTPHHQQHRCRRCTSVRIARLCFRLCPHCRRRCTHRCGNGGRLLVSQ